MPRIAVVDDDTSFLLLVEDILTEQGFEVACLLEDFATLDALKDVLPDLVILDIRGDRPHTLQLLRTLKADKDTQDIPVIVCVAFPQELTDDRAWLQTNSIGVLDKPFDLDDLVECVATALEGDPSCVPEPCPRDTDLSS